MLISRWKYVPAFRLMCHWTRLWLATEGKDYYSDNLQKAFHQREAEFYTGEYKRTADPWNAVNASSHYRKCGQAREADKLLTSIPAKRLKEIKLRSAIVTTHGGVMRDLKHLDEALELGNQAHTLTPKDFRPGTLLGAVNVELGHYDIARDWYAKAIERGASERSIDCDLRGVFLRASPINREEIKAFLLREDPVRYKWRGFNFEMQLLCARIQLRNATFVWNFRGQADRRASTTRSR